MGCVVAIPREFREQMTRLMGLKFAPADMRTHWEALSDVPPVVLEAAVSRAQKIRLEFPSPAELREDCDAVKHYAKPVPNEPDRGQDLPARVVLGTLPDGTVIKADRLWTYYCEPCSDSGTESVWCGGMETDGIGDAGPTQKPWQVAQACERDKRHPAHEWVRPCTCFASNPALIRKRERQQKFADSAKAGKR